MNVTVPALSTRPACSLRDSGTVGISSSTAKARAAGTRKTDRQPKAVTRTPETLGPSARPSPTVVPNSPNARARAFPSKTWASSALPLGRAAAAPIPATARARSRSTMFPASAATSAPAPKSAVPEKNTRLRPTRSASEPAARMKPAKVRL